MEKPFTLSEALMHALNEAERKRVAGKLFTSAQDITEADFEDGDPETIYTLASLYAQFMESPREGEQQLIDALAEVYPEYI